MGSITILRIIWIIGSIITYIIMWKQGKSRGEKIYYSIIWPALGAMYIIVSIRKLINNSKSLGD